MYEKGKRPHNRSCGALFLVAVSRRSAFADHGAVGAGDGGADDLEPGVGMDADGDLDDVGEVPSNGHVATGLLRRDLMVADLLLTQIDRELAGIAQGDGRHVPDVFGRTLAGTDAELDGQRGGDDRLGRDDRMADGAEDQATGGHGGRLDLLVLHPGVETGGTHVFCPSLRRCDCKEQCSTSHWCEL